MVFIKVESSTQCLTTHSHSQGVNIQLVGQSHFRTCREVEAGGCGGRLGKTHETFTQFRRFNSSIDTIYYLHNYLLMTHYHVTVLVANSYATLHHSFSPDCKILQWECRIDAGWTSPAYFCGRGEVRRQEG